MEQNSVSVEVLRPVDYDIVYSVWSDMTMHGWEKKRWLKPLVRARKRPRLLDLGRLVGFKGCPGAAFTVVQAVSGRPRRKP